MNRLAKWTMRLYPARWRKRYGDELDALLADTGADARIVADLFQGGMRMQFKTWSLLKLTLVLGIAGLLLGAAGSFLIAPMYVSKATLQMTPAQISANTDAAAVGNQLNEEIQLLETTLLSRTSLSTIIQDPQLQLYRDELKVTPLEDVIEEMKSNIRITIIALPGAVGRRGPAFDILFMYPDKLKAQQTVQQLVDRFQELSAEAAHPEVAGHHDLEVLDVPSLPVLPIYPNRHVLELIGAALGLSIVFAYRKLRKKKLLAWGFAIPAVLFGMLGAFLADGASILDLVNNQWRSTALMSAPNGTPEQIAQLTQEVLSRTTLSAVIQYPRLRLYPDQMKTTPLEDVIETMKKNLAIRPVGDGRHLTVSFVYSDRFKAQRTVHMIMNRLDEANRRLYGGLPIDPATLFSSVKMEILDVPSMPVTPAKPNRYSMAVTGGIAGALAGAIIALIRRRWRPEGDIPVDAVNG